MSPAQRLGGACTNGLRSTSTDSMRTDGRRHALQPAGLTPLIGESAPMRSLKSVLQRLTDAASAQPGAAAAVLLSGEPGTGKRLIARLLHASGRRCGRPFLSLDCAAVPSARLESDFFGHDRDGWIRTQDAKAGMVANADGGTVFLDNIGAADLTLQARFFELLALKTVRRIGSLHEQRVDLHIIAASREPLQMLLDARRLRTELSACLGEPLIVPPLRERGHDVLLLARHFVDRAALRRGSPPIRLSDQACAALIEHAWPGNVRELRDVLERAVTLAPGGIIEIEHLMVPPGGAARAPTALDLNLHRLEYDTLVRALQHCAWNVTRAARLLGISRDTLRYRIEKHNLGRDMPSI